MSIKNQKQNRKEKLPLRNKKDKKRAKIYNMKNDVYWNKKILERQDV